MGLVGVRLAHRRGAAAQPRASTRTSSWPSTGTPQPPRPDTLAFVVSASGGSEETVEAMERHRGTSTRGRRHEPRRQRARGRGGRRAAGAGRAGGGRHRLPLATPAPWPCCCWSRGCDARRRAPAAESSAGLIERRSEWLGPLADRVEGGAGVWASAPAERIGSALQSALMLREAPRIVADGCETGDWLHVDVYLTKRPGLPPAADARLALRRRGDGVARRARLRRGLRRPRRGRRRGHDPDRPGTTSTWSPA